MLKIYKIKVGEKCYEVQVEAVTEEAGKIETPKAAVEQAPLSGTVVKAPLQGGIFAIKVKEGQQVSKGQLLLIIEAMKLENEILAPVAGTVTDIAVSQGQTVDAGTALISIG